MAPSIFGRDITQEGNPVICTRWVPIHPSFNRSAGAAPLCLSGCHLPDPTCFSLQTTFNSHIFSNFLNLLKENFQKIDTAERIERFIEGQAFLRSNDSATCPLPSLSWTGDTQKDWEREAICCRERGGGRGAESYDRKKAWSSINHSILSAVKYLPSCQPPTRYLFITSLSLLKS